MIGARHHCREHIVRRIPPKSRSFASGGVPQYLCGVCGKSVRVVLKASEVLCRVAHGR